MSEPSREPGKVTPYRLQPNKAESWIRRAASETANVIFGTHALGRMQEREITDVEVFRTLRTGGIVGTPELAEPGEWKCKIVQRAKGGRDIGVVLVLLKDKKLFIKTVEWEDTR